MVGWLWRAGYPPVCTSQTSLAGPVRRRGCVADSRCCPSPSRVTAATTKTMTTGRQLGNSAAWRCRRCCFHCCCRPRCWPPWRHCRQLGDSWWGGGAAGPGRSRSRSCWRGCQLPGSRSPGPPVHPWVIKKYMVFYFELYTSLRFQKNTFF